MLEINFSKSKPNSVYETKISHYLPLSENIFIFFFDINCDLIIIFNERFIKAKNKSIL